MADDNEFKNCEGRVFLFYGVDNDKFKLGNQVWEGEAIEIDEYREGYGIYYRQSDPTDIFFRTPLAEVEVKQVYYPDVFDGYQLIDIQDGHVWLKVGLDIYDSYYPHYRFDYSAKERVSMDESRCTSAFTLVVSLEDGSTLPVLFAHSQQENDRWFTFFQQDQRVLAIVSKNTSSGEQEVWTKESISHAQLLKVLGFQQRR